MKYLLRIVAFLAITLAVVAGVYVLGKKKPSTHHTNLPELVGAPPTQSVIAQSGEFLLDGYPKSADTQTFTAPATLKMMKYNVSEAEYQRCVDAKACPSILKKGRQPADNLPIVGVSWQNANAYAEWYAKQTGLAFRLPTDMEWSHFTQQPVGNAFASAMAPSSNNPAQAWLDEYRQTYATKQNLNPNIQPFGSFGTSEYGLVDVNANVWDWTNTCYRRVHARSDSEETVALENCGIRVAAGPHTAYMADFIGDPKSGACSVGIPPAHLGIRLVVDMAQDATP